MNIYLEDEKKAINTRMQELEAAQKRMGIGTRFALASNHVSILKDDMDEYNGLVRMKEIIEHNFEMKSRFEYLEEREKTKLPRITEKELNYFIDPKTIVKEEQNRIDKRQYEIVSNYKMAGKKVPFTIASDGVTVNKSDLEEYEKLVEMKKVIANNFNTKKYYDYMDLRVATSIGQMGDKEYAALLGKYNPNKEIHEEVKKEPEVIKPEDIIITDNHYTGPAIILGEEKKKEPVPEIILPPEDIRKKKDEPVIPEEPASTSSIDSPEQNEANDYSGPVLPGQEIAIISPQDIVPLDDDYEVVDEKPVKVVDSKAWNWIKGHKKQILIALGITALSISVIVVITQLLPAIMAASQASQVAGLAGEMMTNGQMYFAASASEKFALHGANTALADVITSLTGVTNTFTEASGVWTLGSQTLPEFATTAAATAASAASKVSLLSGVGLGSALGGLGALGVGMLLKNKSAAYKIFVIKIKELKRGEISDDAIAALTEEIQKSTELSLEEKKVLLQKLNVIMKRNKKNRIEEIIQEQPDLSEEQREQVQEQTDEEENKL